MKPEAEKKILKSYLKLLEKPDAGENSYKWIARILFTIFMLFVFLYFSDDMPEKYSVNEIAIYSLIAGVCFGFGFWFSQMASQTKIITKHISKESIEERINEINT